MTKKLSDRQREWLDAALKAKGRFTRAASIKGDWEDYVRRREKAKIGGAGLLPDDPRKKMVDAGLKAADALAKSGKFSDAYKSLDAIKKIGTAASTERAATVSVDNLRVRLNVFRSELDNVASLVDFTEGYYKTLIQQMQAVPGASTKATLAEATTYLHDFAPQEVIFRAELAGREQWIHKCNTAVEKAKLSETLTEIERDIAVHVGAGNAALVQPLADRASEYRSRLKARPLYANMSLTIELGRANRGLFVVELDRIRDLSRFRDIESTVTPDAQTSQARKGLSGETGGDWIEVEAGDRVDAAKRLLAIAGYRDQALSRDTKNPDIRPSPDLKAFDPDLVFDDVMRDVFGTGDVPDDLPFGKAEELAGKARAKLKAVLAGLPPGGDEMFDLMLTSEEQLARMCNRAMTGIDSSKGVSASHQALLPKMAKGMREEILAAAPNKMKDDGSEITVNGKVYALVGVIGEGANGAVRRYASGDDTVVVKTLKSGARDEEGFQDMAAEMRTHRKLMTGADDGVADAGNIVRMEGAAVSNDGSLHMMLEEAEAGDMNTVGNNMVMLQGMGILPDAARNVLALDMIAQTAKGMKAMQERGLVQNDLKPQNLMVNKDGTVKIIDFGESRFADPATGEIGKANDDDDRYGTTPGYEAPEHYGKTGKVTAKADAHALGGIIKRMMNPVMSEGAVASGIKPVSAVGRVAAALTDQDPDKRPSLDAVLMSSLLDQDAGEANPEDVKDLQKAAAGVNVAMKAIRGSVPPEDLKANTPPGKYVDTMWMPFHNKGIKERTEVPIAAFNTMVVKIDDYINDTRKQLAVAVPGEVMGYRDLLAKAEKQKEFWIRELNAQMEAQRAEGRAEIEAVINDEWNEVQVPGEGGGYLQLSDAVKLRDRALAEIPRIQNEFYALAADKPDEAAAAMDATNRRLKELDLQIKTVNDEITRLAGPKGKYVLAEAKLAEVAAKFGPNTRRPTTPDKPEEKPDPLPPLPPEAEGKIPDPPAPPKERKLAN